MKEIIIANFGHLGVIIIAGIIILILFLALSIFKTLFNNALVGLLLALFSYLVYDYTVYNIPIIASIALLISITGFERGIIKKIIALLGTLLSIYIILTHLGVI
ncbi:MAG: hypothetical protein IJZ36_02125 [Bacilli bacterium]|nr:hypothetical protein [Bacilli bacterium]